jgi:hypothetical protein
MDLLGFDKKEQLIDFLNSPERPTGTMVSPGQIQQETQVLAEGKEEIHGLFLSLDGHGQPDAIGAGSESAGETLKELPDEHPMQRAAQAAWEDLLGKTRELPASAARVIITNEPIIKPEADGVGRDTIVTGEPKRPATQREISEIGDDAVIEVNENNHSGIRAIGEFVRKSACAVGLALGWNVRRHEAIHFLPQSGTSRLSVRRTWPLLTGAGIATAWFFSPFNAFPALVLLTLSLQFSFNHLKKRSSPIFLKSALLFFILFVPTGVAHDAFFDHPTAICSDGRYSYSASRSGTCSGHNGVSQWYPKRKHWWQYGPEYGSSGIPSQSGRRRKAPSAL